MVKKHKPQYFFLMEKRGKRKMMENIARRLRYQHIFVVEPHGIAGGHLFMWTEETELCVCWNCDRIIRSEITETTGIRNWYFLEFMGLLIAKKKAAFWSILDVEIRNYEKSWLILGVLNEVMDESEKFGGRTIWNHRLYLRGFIQKVGAIDLGFELGKFTWDNGHMGNSFINERLDRGLACKEWVFQFHIARVFHLLNEESDHIPILLNTEEMETMPRRPLWYFKVESGDNTSFAVVENAWRRHCFHQREAKRTIQRLNQTAQAFKRWNKFHFGNSFEHIKGLEGQPIQLQSGRDRIRTIDNEIELKKHRATHESILHQKSREL